jgi:hypothetical protein
LALPPKLLAVARRQADGAGPKLGPGGMGTAGLRDAVGGNVQRAAATLLGPGDIEVRTVAAIRMAMTGAVGVAAAAGGLGQPALDHGTGGAKELAEERGFLPNHIITLGITRQLCQEKEHTWARYLQSRMRK